MRKHTDLISYQMCQQFIRALSSDLPASALAAKSSPPRIIIIGCGAPDLIREYAATTSCAYPMYSDPTRAVFSALNLTSTLDMGTARPAYQQDTTAGVVVSSFFQTLGGLKGGKALRAGNYAQVGGEFLFEGGRAKWCHRMRHTRDHSELQVLRGVLGV